MEDIQRKVEDIDRIVLEKGSKTWMNRVKRKKARLIKEKRYTKRNLGSGRRAMIDEGGQRYVAKCIEDNATAHDRRHDDKLDVGRRVKKMN